MYVINGKRFLFIFTSLLISLIGVFSFNKNDKSIMTSSLPISNKLIILDAGHRIS